jgi:hypothetical protein
MARAGGRGDGTLSSARHMTLPRVNPAAFGVEVGLVIEASLSRNMAEYGALATERAELLRWSLPQRKLGLFFGGASRSDWRRSNQRQRTIGFQHNVTRATTT